MRRIYAARRRALIEALKPGEGKLYRVDASPAGLMLLLRLPAGVSDEETVESARAPRHRDAGAVEPLCGPQAASRGCC
jgi:DNA-binding transcriptional MocR family regulator